MSLFRLECGVQPYPWGSVDAIPALLGREPTGHPQAELWVGAHSMLPSTVAQSGVPLDAHIAINPIAALGLAVVERFGPQLPFLLKVLAVAAPLSLQAHPSAAQAKDGYEREDAAGIARTAPYRSYRDANAKPELVCALSRLEALCGFRPPGESAEVFRALGGRDLGSGRGVPRGPGLCAIADELDALHVLDARGATDAAGAGLVRVVGDLLTLSKSAQAQLVAELAAGLDASLDAGQAGRLGSGLGHLRDLAQRYPGDAGVIVASLLQHVVLAPGEALFLGPGVLHAYLHGTAIEILANSDNVLRGGLTNKHVDVPELLNVLAPATDETPILRGVCAGAVRTFPVPVPDFELSVVRAPARVTLDGGRPSLLLCTEGSCLVGGLAMHQGDAVFVEASTPPLDITMGVAAETPAGDDSCVLWRASVRS